MKKSTSIDTLLRTISPVKPKGQQRYSQLLERAAENDQLTLFVPWAAPPTGRTELGQSERKTLQWLLDAAAKIGEVVTTNTILMPADAYAARNGFNLVRAQTYWGNVIAITERQGFTTLPTTEIEEDPAYATYLARQSYAFEKLPDVQQAKIMKSAQKYSGSPGDNIYESAADYSMRRAAEAEYVDKELGVLWISLNYPERDVMCGEAPRIYAPEDVRTPWLREDIA